MTTTEERPVDYVRPLNPEDVEAEIDRIRKEIRRGVRIVSDAETAADASSAAYDRAHARACINSDKSTSTEKKWDAEIDPDVVAARDKRDVEAQAARYARRRADALEKELSAMQAINRSMIAMYGSERGVGG